MRGLRAVGLIAVVALCALLGGCGTAKRSSGASRDAALASELAYLPADAPLVITMQTGPSSSGVKGAQALLGHFPIAGLGEQALYGKLAQLGISYQSEIRPLLGHPLVFGLDAVPGNLSAYGAAHRLGSMSSGAHLPSAASAASAASNEPFLFVFQTPSAAKLSALIAHTHASVTGTYAGAKLIDGGPGVFAIDGATLLFGPTAQVKAALDRHHVGGGMSITRYAQLTAGLPTDGLLQLFGDLKGVLSTAKAAKARSIPWVGAITGYGATLVASGSGLQARFRLDTTGAALSAGQLPLSSASGSPQFAGSGPISVGLSRPGQSLAFILQIARTVDLARYSKLPAADRADLQALAGELSGPGTLSSDTHTTLARFGLADPTTAAAQLRKLVADHGIGPRGVVPRAVGGGFYAFDTGHGTTVTLGTADGKLLIGRASVAALKAFATAPASAAPNAEGSLAFRVALLPLLKMVLKHVPTGIAASLLAQLGDVTGWARATPDALTGSAMLGVH